MYYWPSGMNREPVVLANIEDIINDMHITDMRGDKRFDWDFYDSHCYVEALKAMRTAGIIAQWTENGLTDLLAAPDGGLIK